MCGIFGFSDYKHRQPIGLLAELCNALARESEVRGDHATGIACSNGRTIKLYKEAKPASKLDFQLPKHTVAVMGHTRHATQGSEKDNRNNHPFIGRIGNTQFALAHNGIIHNDRQLRRELNLPPTRVETDSYIGVQLLETQKELSNSSHAYMAEKIKGSFTFSTLDQHGNLYITKGNSPVSLIHFEEMGLFVYASTESILWNAIMKTRLFGYIKNALSSGSKVYKTTFPKIEEGEIMKMSPNGTINRSKFAYTEYELAFDWYDIQYSYGRRIYGYSGYLGAGNVDMDSFEELMEVASGMGVDEDDILALYDMGLDRLAIEDLIYNPDALNEYLADI